MKDEIREFLMARRAAVRPEDVGLPQFGGERRVPGLRREEVAVLAGVSTDYYIRLERGQLRGASESVLAAIAQALCLNPTERTHLFDLARADAARPPRPDDPAPTVVTQLDPATVRILDGLRPPAAAYNARQDILATNAAGRILFAPHLATDRPNFSRFIFLDPASRQFYRDWETSCQLNAALLRLEAGRDPLNIDLTSLIGELATLSPDFRRHWADQHVHEHRTGLKKFHHPQLGDLQVTYDVIELPGTPGISITTNTGADTATRNILDQL